MSCSGCSTNDGVPGGCKQNGACTLNGCDKLTVFDWLTPIGDVADKSGSSTVEVAFQNGRKEFYVNAENLELLSNELVVVEAQSGHDVGRVSCTGQMADFQMKRKGVKSDKVEQKLYRKVTKNDLKKWTDAKAKEKDYLASARKIVLKEELGMKISEVECQGDNNKAIFYFTAEKRVDFRNLIKTFRDTFKIRIEMKQLGARQDAALLGGIGECGRELCCSTWMHGFASVSTGAARYQQLSLNPQKLAGQCGKLKCCLNFELDNYMDALKDIPPKKVKLITKKGKAVFQKLDIFGRRMWYYYLGEPEKIIELTVDIVKDLVEKNKNGVFPPDLLPQ